MIAHFIDRKTIQRQFLHADKSFDLLLRLGGHRCLCSEVEDLNALERGLSVSLQDPIHLVHARGSRRPQISSRRKPVSLPAEDFPVEVEQLSIVARRRGTSADLHKHLDALNIAVNSHHVSKALTLIDDAESAISFFVWASRQPEFTHNVYTCISLIVILARAKEFGKIWELLSEMRSAGLSLSDACFNLLIKAYGEMGNDKEAIQTLRKMHEFGVSPTAYSYNTLICALLKSQKIDIAVELYQEMLRLSDAEETVFSSSMLVSSLCNAGRLKEALGIAADASMRGTSPSQFTWTSLIHGFFKAGNVEKGIELFSTMKDMGIEPTVVTYSVIISGLSKSGRISDAFAYLERMKDDNLEPTNITYTPLLDAICKAGRIDEGNLFWKRISTTSGPVNPILCQILVVAYSRSEKIDEACMMYDQMVKDGCQPCASTYAVLIQALWKAERSKKAFEIFNEMKAAKCEPNAAVYKAMVRGLAKAGSKDEAEKTFLEMMEKGYEANAGTCKDLIGCLCKQGVLDSATKTMRIMLSKNLEVNMPTIGIYLKRLCVSRQVDVALEFFKEIAERGLKPDTRAYNILIHGAYKEGKLEMGLELCADMERNGCARDIYTYAELCKIAWKANNAEAVTIIYQHMRNQHVQANPFVFSIIMKALCWMNEVPEACSLCTQIFEDGFMFSESDDPRLNLDKIGFLNVQVFLPLLFYLQDCGAGKEVVNLWDSVLQKGIFSWSVPP